MWLRAERQTAGRGRQGRAWASPPGNLYASTLVRLHAGEPPAPTLAFVAAVALEEVVRGISPSPFAACGGSSLSRWERKGAAQPREGEDDAILSLKWPNDLLIDGAKLAGILLERSDDAVVIGFGVNLAHHPTNIERPVTSLAAHGAPAEPAALLERLASAFATWLARWRSEGLGPVLGRWGEGAHPIGTPLAARLPDASAVDGRFDGLDAQGALILRLADGTRRVIHAGDVFLV